MKLVYWLVFIVIMVGDQPGWRVWAALAASLAYFYMDGRDWEARLDAELGKNTLKESPK